jgi:hypothetical protein
MAYGQMTIIHESGVGTNDSIIPLGFVSMSTASTPPGPIAQRTGQSIEVTESTHSGAEAAYIMGHFPEMSLYHNLEFYVEYTSTNPANDFHMYADSAMQASSDPSYPVAGSLVSADYVSMTSVSFLSEVKDSILKFQLFFSDTGKFTINYLRISADLTTAVSVEENTLNEIDVTGRGNQIYVNSATDEAYNLQVFDLSGKQVYHGQIIGESIIDPRLTSGVYVVRISSVYGMISRKVFLD